MLRGYRWQFLALVIAVGLFSVSLITRLTHEPDVVEATPVSATADVSPTATAIPEVATALPAVIEPQATTPSIPTYREGLVGNVQRLNPLFAGLNPVDRDITSLIFEGLTRTDTYGEPQPALAKSWVISSDGLEYVITLRDDVLWQDGLPFSARDVMYTMSILRSPDFPGSEELRTFWRTVETEQLGDYLIRFRLSQPLGSFLGELSIGILPAHALEGIGAAQLADHPFNLSPIGTGPYQLERLGSTQGDRIDTVDLRVAPVYRQRPEGQNGYALERVSFHLYNSFDAAVSAFQIGDVDALAAESRVERDQLLTVSGNTYTTVKPQLGVLIFNWAKEDTNFFREQRVRMALEIGLDRASIIERHLSNEAVQADSPLLPGSWAYSGAFSWPTHDINAAKAMLDSANIQTDEDSDSVFRFTILAPNDPALVNVAQEIAAQWSQLNLAVTVEAEDEARYQERLETHDFDAALVELALGTDPDVYAFWHQGQYPDGKNYGGVDDRYISEALERARRDANGLHRAIYYEDFQRYFVERAIAIPLYYPLYTYETAPDVTGVQLGFVGAPPDRFRTIQDWVIESPG